MEQSTPPVSTLINTGNTTEKLWRSPKYYWYIMPTVTILLAGTITKFFLPPFHKTIITQIGDAVLKKPLDYLDASLYGLWLVGPPVFFLIEYVWIFGKNEKNRLDTKQRDDLKYCQDLAGKIWAAITILLSIILAVKYDIAFH